jgi:hypothetical protein
MQFEPNVLKAEALKVVGKFQCSKDCFAGGVGAAVLSASGEIFTGICIVRLPRMYVRLTGRGHLLDTFPLFFLLPF